MKQLAPEGGELASGTPRGVPAVSESDVVCLKAPRGFGAREDGFSSSRFETMSGRVKPSQRKTNKYFPLFFLFFLFSFFLRASDERSYQNMLSQESQKMCLECRVSSNPLVSFFDRPLFVVA